MDFSARNYRHKKVKTEKCTPPLFLATMWRISSLAEENVENYVETVERVGF
jgi:hypothetical protein